MKTLATLLLVFLILVLGAGQSYGGGWIKDVRNPILTGGAIGTWNHDVSSPCILYNSDSLRYEMWFNASAGTTADLRPLCIGFATSPDGINWNMYSSAVLSPSPETWKWDAYTVEKPAVIRENGQYKMWYTSYVNVAPTYPGYIGFATSPDGIHWTKYSGNPVLGPGQSAWEAGGPFSCDVMPYQGGYKMWYAGWDLYSTYTSIGYATSLDGITWQRDTLHNPVMTRGGVGAWDHVQIYVPRVTQIGTTYHMWYLGNSGSSGSIGYAWSTDFGSTWQKDPSNPVVSYSPATWEASGLVPGTVFLQNNTLHMWYAGGEKSGLLRIGHASYGLWVSLVSPPDSFNGPGHSVTFIWNRTATPSAKYRLQLATDSAFTQLVLDDSTLTDTTTTVGGLAYAQSYFWRVCARDPLGWGIYSARHSLTLPVSPGDGGDQNVPLQFALGQNYPNPFNPISTIGLSIAESGVVTLKVYDILGCEVATLVNEKKTPGRYEVEFDGSGLSSGIYFYRLTAGQFVETRKMVLMK